MIGAVPETPTNWLEFVGGLVVCFGVPLEDAWNCTMKEFWAIMDVHMVRLGHKKRFLAGGSFHTIEDVNELENELRQMGLLE